MLCSMTAAIPTIIADKKLGEKMPDYAYCVKTTKGYLTQWTIHLKEFSSCLMPVVVDRKVAKYLAYRLNQESSEYDASVVKVELTVVE